MSEIKKVNNEIPRRGGRAGRGKKSDGKCGGPRAQRRKKTETYIDQLNENGAETKRPIQTEVSRESRKFFSKIDLLFRASSPWTLLPSN